MRICAETTPTHSNPATAAGKPKPRSVGGSVSARGALAFDPGLLGAISGCGAWLGKASVAPGGGVTSNGSPGGGVGVGVGCADGEGATDGGGVVALWVAVRVGVGDDVVRDGVGLGDEATTLMVPFAPVTASAKPYVPAFLKLTAEEVWSGASGPLS